MELVYHFGQHAVCLVAVAGTRYRAIRFHAAKQSARLLENGIILDIVIRQQAARLDTTAREHQAMAGEVHLASDFR